MARRTDYTDWSKEDLIERIKALEKRKKYGLIWDEEREPEKVVQQCKVKLPILKEVKNKYIKNGSEEPTHILIEGDNYHALSVLNYTHEKSIDVIYIDPPFNTGSTAWIYNNKYIDKEDTFKHSKWVSFMYKRLKLARNLLSPTGIIICAIDDYEMQNLRHILDDLFLENNRLGSITVIHNPGGRQDDKFIATAHEYMLIYARNKNIAEVKHLGIPKKKLMEYIYEDEFGKYKLREFRRSGSNSRRVDRPGLWYPIYLEPEKLEIDIEPFEGCIELLPIDPDGIERVWRWGKKSLMDKKNKYIQIIKNDESINIFVKEREIDNKGEKPKTLWNKSEYSATNGTNELKRIMGTSEKLFDYPKSHYLIRDILKITSNDNSIILDFFAGSGTTGQAVLELNSKEGSNRQFILCTNNELGPKRLQQLRDKGLSTDEIKKEGVCRKVCYPRLKKLIEGFEYNGNQKTILFEERLNLTKFNRISEIYENYLETKVENQEKFDNLSGEFKEKTLRLWGVKNITESQEGLGGNLKYFMTDFVPATPTDKNKEKLTKMSVEMLCLRENTFDLVSKTTIFQIFQNREKCTGILFDQLRISEFKEKIKDFNKPISVYIFSLSDDDFAEEFFDMQDRVKVCSIPEAILRVYRRIFK